ncbi:hypothetical protein D3C71_1477900 [compost metagenome]
MITSPAALTWVGLADLSSTSCGAGGSSGTLEVALPSTLPPPGATAVAVASLSISPSPPPRSSMSAWVMVWVLPVQAMSAGGAVPNVTDSPGASGPPGGQLSPGSAGSAMVTVWMVVLPALVTVKL